jgi:hypothetical protein
MAAARPPQDRELGEPERIASSDAGPQACVVRDHRVACHVVAHRPQRHDQRLGAGTLERAPQTIHAFTIANFANARVARGKRDEPRTP